MLIILIVSAINSSSFALDNYPKNNYIDITAYNFYLKLNDLNDSIYGQTEIDVKVKEKGIEGMELDLTSIEENSNGQGMIVDSVMLIATENSKLTFEHEQGRLSIFFTELIPANSYFSIKVFYRGIPQDGLIISQNKYGNRTFFGDNWPNRAHHWLPCIDHPYEKAFCKFTVEAPMQYNVIASGRRTEESLTSNGGKITQWESIAPLATKVMVIGVAEFAIQYLPEVNQIPVEQWVFPENKVEGFYDYSPAAEILNYFHNRIGPFAYAKLANVQSKTRYGGMENAGNIFYYENSVTGNKSIENLIAHEIAHQWFGDAVTESDWHHVWLSEGFATYFTNLYVEHKYGKDSLDRLLIKQKKQILTYYKEHPNSVVIDYSISKLELLLNTNTYQKGGWFLHMLRYELGDEVFFKGIKEYYNRFKNGNASTDDFQFLMEKISKKPLDWFFEQWLYHAGLPKIKTEWKYDKRKKNVNFSVTQEQTEAPFRYTLRLQIHQIDNTHTYHNIEISQRNQTFELPVSGKPISIVSDPQNTLLLYETK